MCVSKWWCYSAAMLSWILTLQTCLALNLISVFILFFCSHNGPTSVFGGNHNNIQFQRQWQPYTRWEQYWEQCTSTCETEQHWTIWDSNKIPFRSTAVITFPLDMIIMRLPRCMHLLDNSLFYSLVITGSQWTSAALDSNLRLIVRLYKHS